MWPALAVAWTLVAVATVASGLIVWDTAVNRSGGEWRPLNVLGAAAIDLPVSVVVGVIALRRRGSARRMLLAAALGVALLPLAVEVTRRLADRHGATGSLFP